MHQWKAKNSRIEYLLVGVSRNTKNENKMRLKVAWESNNRKLREVSLLNEGGGGSFLVQKTSPSLIFYNMVQGLLAQAS